MEAAWWSPGATTTPAPSRSTIRAARFSRGTTSGRARELSSHQSSPRCLRRLVACSTPPSDEKGEQLEAPRHRDSAYCGSLRGRSFRPATDSDIDAPGTGLSETAVEWSHSIRSPDVRAKSSRTGHPLTPRPISDKKQLRRRGAQAFTANIVICRNFYAATETCDPRLRSSKVQKRSNAGTTSLSSMTSRTFSRRTHTPNTAHCSKRALHHVRETPSSSVAE